MIENRGRELIFCAYEPRIIRYQEPTICSCKDEPRGRKETGNGERDGRVYVCMYVCMREPERITREIKGEGERASNINGKFNRRLVRAVSSDARRVSRAPEVN